MSAVAVETPTREDINRAAERIAAAEQPPAFTDEIVVEGSAQLDLFDTGGKRPTRAVLSLTGAKAKIVSGECFKKGERIHFSGEAVVWSSSDEDETDSQTQQVTDCERRQKARVIDLTVEQVLG